MAVDYEKIWNSMEYDKQYTAAQLGVAPASMTAMARRGFVKTIDTKPKQYVKILSVVPKILEIVKKENPTHFCLHKENAPYGMLCSLGNNKILDCYGNEYDTTNVVELEVNHKKYNLKEN